MAALRRGVRRHPADPGPPPSLANAPRLWGAWPEPDRALTAAAEPGRESAWPRGSATTGEENVAASLRVDWPAIRGGMAQVRSLGWCLEFVRPNACRLGPRARELEERAGADS